MATEYQLELAAKRAAELFEHRTMLVATGQTRNVNDLLASSRVRWSEVVSWIDGPVCNTGDRPTFQKRFEEALRKRGLLKVLRSKQTAEDWHNKRHGK